jgi:hypothetical protein
MHLYGEATTDPTLRRKGMSNPTHTPDPDDLRELCGLVRCLRAWAHTNTDEHDDGRDHILYPMRQQRPDTGANEGPLWAAISVVLDRNGFGHYS